MNVEYPPEVGGMVCPLELPKSAAVRGDILACLNDVNDPQIQRRIIAACLVLCSPELQRRGAPTYNGRLLEFGGKAIDWLVSKKATATEISTAGNDALQLVCDDFLRQVEAEKAARGNSEPPAGGSSESSGPSSGSGAVIPIGSGRSAPSGEAS